MKCSKCEAELKGIGPQIRGTCNICDLLAVGEMLASQTPACWPKQSWALGVLPHQVQERMEHDRKHGVPTDYKLTDDGYAAQPVYTDRGHRKRHLKLHGARDNSGGYGD